MAPRRDHYTYSDETPAGHIYLTASDGSIVLNDDGESVMSFVRSCSMNVFRYDMLTNWKQVNQDTKDFFVQCVKDEFPQPNKGAEFQSKWLLQYVGQLIGHRRSEARDRYKDGYSKPDWLEEETWQMIAAERDGNPNLFEQQVRARAQQTSAQTSHLGSGGKAAMKRDFVSTSIVYTLKFMYFH